VMITSFNNKRKTILFIIYNVFLRNNTSLTDSVSNFNLLI
jgi:hypothetical protein